MELKFVIDLIEVFKLEAVPDESVLPFSADAFSIEVVPDIFTEFVPIFSDQKRGSQAGIDRVTIVAPDDTSDAQMDKSGVHKCTIFVVGKRRPEEKSVMKLIIVIQGQPELEHSITLLIDFQRIDFRVVATARMVGEADPLDGY